MDEACDPLTATIVAAFGRTGTTAVMAWLATDPRVATGREYPFEHRYLTWMAKVAALAERRASALDPVELETWSHDGFGPPPWAVAAGSLTPSRDELLRSLWLAFSRHVRDRQPGAAFYAEKAPEWVAPVVRAMVPTRVLHLVRDPRDVFLSATAFVARTGAIGFGASDAGPLARARHVAHRMLSFHENARAEPGDAASLRVRYEDLLQTPGVVANRVRQTLGIQVSGSPGSLGDHDRRHRTAPSPERSVRRWQHEGLPADVQACLELQLHDLMRENGYATEICHEGPRCVRLEDCSLASADGVLDACGDRFVVTLTGGDFGLHLPVDALDAPDTHEVWACLRGRTGDHCSVYWRHGTEPFSEDRVSHVPFRPGPHWQIVRLPLADHRSWTGRASGLRIDLLNGHVTSGPAGELRWIRLVA